MAESSVVLNGVRHWLRVVGDPRAGTPIVVVHGGPGGFIYDFERLTGPLLEKLGPVVYYEQRGSGRSDQDGQYAVSVLVLIGLWDRNAGVDACRDLATRLPRAQLRVFDESAHFPNVEEPEQYVAEIAAFLHTD